ncbi:bifunctional serine/threonine-protein kinase/universal stress protein [Zavarzinia compransoris]|uniref:Serine/threonine protein kinase n=1 Tax=Zavarzinia compransoris TaxID=1264899 RepID=A0A317E4A6_9PROT|nr:bifunctional serine/threonine-protein kinase/universal stress protein [Zavarzinia compransoris]PWR21877.1 serine/threonine protein kinase [Zavarzinia compransoris]TDP45317.1 non-specific serine/threonine protein kinase/protein-serine/threonine kinase [Zavarzinia compransoris]
MPAPKVEPGAVIDGYAIDSQIHRGGMATLWALKTPAGAMPLIMKVPRLAEGEDPAAIVGFEMEQMILPRLAGPHVPRFVAAGDFRTLPYIVMEWIQGRSLHARLPDLPLPPAEVAEIGARAAVALDALHRQQVVHLDVKPSNIMVRPGGDMALIDFGLSHHLQLPDLLDEEFRLPYGTAPYMAPEQVLGQRAEPRSDLFALGSLMYFFVTGTRPFGDPQTLKGLKKRLWRDPVPPRRLRPDCPPWLQEIILRCLEVDPENRHPTAAQLALDLRTPEQVPLTARAERRDQDGFIATFKRRLDVDAILTVNKRAGSATAPIIMAAIDFDTLGDEAADAMRDMIRQLMVSMPRARLACVNVLKLRRIGLDSTLDEDGDHKHLQRLIELRHWARPLGLAEGSVTFHVLEATKPADAILDYARANGIDHIVMGARERSTMRSLLGSVSGEVAAEAPCTVTVVRARKDPAE